MLTEERKNFILKQIAKHHIVNNNDLAKQLNTSISTIRRDLQELEDDDLLIRIHGGAKQREVMNLESSTYEKASKNVQAKKAIAQFASEIIKNGDIVYLDAGTTTYEMLNLLQGKEIKVVTNSIMHASKLVQLNIPTFILGGFIKDSTKAVVHSIALSQLQQLHFDCAFIGTNTIHQDYGYMTPDPEEGSLKQIAIRQSQKAYILADHTKFDHLSFTCFANLNEAQIITDYLPSKCKLAIEEQTTVKELNL